MRCACEFPNRLLLPKGVVFGCEKCLYMGSNYLAARREEEEEERRAAEALKTAVAEEHRRMRELQHNTIHNKMRRAEKAFVKAAEVEGLTYLQAMRACEHMRRRFQDLKDEQKLPKGPKKRKIN